MFVHRGGVGGFFKVRKSLFLELTVWGVGPITRFIDGGNVAGDRALRSKLLKLSVDNGLRMVDKAALFRASPEVWFF